jgi:hypothetical protein
MDAFGMGAQNAGEFQHQIQIIGLQKSGAIA